MRERLLECLNNQCGSYVIPFLWYAGEDFAAVAEEMDAIHRAGIQEFILENRGGDWFCTDPWMQLIEQVLQKAGNLNMRVWMLDDSHVNTGSANDSMGKEENASIRQQNVRIVPVDVPGPVSDGALMLPRHTKNEKILSITAYRRNETTGCSYGTPLDLTDRVMDELCLLDLPEGIWRVYFVLTADPDLQGLFAHYISMVSKDSCRHLINEVHEKIYARFKSYFGNVFAGFFSDEPAFGNCNGEYGPDFSNHRMGQLNRLYPWWNDFPERLAARSKIRPDEVMRKLPALWDDVEGVSPSLRIDYMDLITDLWRENFSGQIGKWCEEHGVRYIGHNLEDSGAHMHTGWGCGHFFRSMSGQHMAGVDIVLNQMLPGVTSISYSRENQIFDVNFYRYTLAKLGSSLAHLTPHMQDRALCEIMGAYGWTAGLSIMYALFNHFLANGTNHFVPHAFSMVLPEAFQKADKRDRVLGSNLPPGYVPGVMPPSFYARGFNPQYPGFCRVLQYVQRVCHLLSQGTHQADVALYYHAEVDWMNTGTMQNMDEVAAKLTRSGFDFDFVPADNLLKNSFVENGRLKLGKETYSALICPTADMYPEKLLRRLDELAQAGLPVIFSGDLPQAGDRSDVQIEDLLKYFHAVNLSDIPAFLETICEKRLQITPWNEEIRYYVLKQSDGSKCVVFLNEGRKSLTFQIQSKENEHCIIYDPWRNEAFNGDSKQTLCLGPQQLMIVFFTVEAADFPKYPVEIPEMREFSLLYDIFMCPAGTNSEFTQLRKKSPAVNLTIEEKLTRFCGFFRYDTELEWDGSSATRLEIPQGGDCSELWINGEYCGTEIGPVCRFHIEGKLKKGRNTLRIETADNPSYIDRGNAADSIVFGRVLPLVKHGFTGAIKIG